MRLVNVPEGGSGLPVIGRVGENGVTRIALDVSRWIDEYPDGTGVLLFKRPDGEIYPLAAEVSAGALTAVITSTELAVEGTAYVEAQWWDGEQISKSAAYWVSIIEALGDGGVAPSAEPDWATRVIAAGVTVSGVADAEMARAVAETGRATAETARAGAEIERESAETARETAETERAATAAANEAVIDAMVDTVAKQDTAELILAAIRQEVTSLQRLVEQGINVGRLNGFWLTLGTDGSVELLYANPEDNADIRVGKFPTDTTGALIVAELTAITSSLEAMTSAT